jgi:hypothetical protein
MYKIYVSCCLAVAIAEYINIMNISVFSGRAPLIHFAKTLARII